jgi:hypothetical protein
MKTYILKKEIPGVALKIGDEVKQVVNITNSQGIITGYQYISNVELALLIHCGFIEEKREWKAEELKVGDIYWYLDSNAGIYQDVYFINKTTQYRLKTGNVFETQEQAEAHYKKVMEI